jgi:hypothetical protein
MRTNAVLTEGVETRADEETLREVVEALAPLERLAGSEGERDAAHWIAERLNAAGASATVDEEEFLDGFAPLIGAMTAAGALSGLASIGGRRRKLGIAGGAAAAALIADEVSNGFRPARRAAGQRKRTWNVVAQAGDPDADRTLVLMAHHDAARTGLAFDQNLQRKLTDWFPGIIERIDTSLPQWWIAVGAPAMVAAGAATRRRGLIAAGTALSAFATAALADIARSPVVPGANDNLTAVAVLVSVAETLRERPIPGLRIILASCGAEEVLQGGVYGLATRHLSQLDRGRTWLLNFDTVGSPELAMLEGEGPMVMEDYFDRGLRDLCARVAERDGIPMRRGMRARSSTDSVIPSRMGIPTACFASLNRHKGLSNYHLPSDTPDRLHYKTVACAADLAEAVARELADPAAAGA